MSYLEVSEDSTHVNLRIQKVLSLMDNGNLQGNCNLSWLIKWEDGRLKEEAVADAYEK